MICFNMGRIDKGIELGSLVLKFIEKYPDGKYNGAAQTIYCLFIGWRTMRLSEMDKLVENTFQTCVSLGDMTYAGYCCSQRIVRYLDSSIPLDIILEKMKRWVDFLDRYSIKLSSGNTKYNSFFLNSN